MSILIVGGAGYIGSHQVKAMCDDGKEVIVLDNLNTGFIEAIDSRALFIKGDVRDYKVLEKIFTTYKIETIIHFAALSLVGESVIKPLEYYDNNVYGMQVLLRAMVDFNIKNIVFSSTAAVYGIPDTELITEKTKKEPINTYGETKLAMEKMIEWVAKAHDVNYVSLRYFNVCGASNSETIGECHNPETHLIPLVLQVPLNKREKISIFGDDYNTFDGTCVRDYIHVDDLVNAHTKAVEYLQNGGVSDIFNLGYGNGFSVKEIIEAARKVTNHPIPVELSQRRPGDPDCLVADSSKAQQILKWHPQYNDINYIISSAYNFYKKFPNGY
ncbi:MAG: UDP-glucose 4-epimerase GalE [Bacilli bacterium]